MIRVLLVDDQEMIRVGLRAVLGSFDDLHVVGEVAHGHSALDVISETVPDVVLLDIRMPGIDGIEVLRRLRAQDEQRPAVIILTTFDTEQYVLESLRAGANGVLNKTAGPHELASAIRGVVAGGGALSPAAAATLIQRNAEERARPVDQDLRGRFDLLTPRELELVVRAAHGASNDEIAAALVLSPATVKTHIGRAMLKLEARDRAQLVAFAYQAGLAE